MSESKIYPNKNSATTIRQKPKPETLKRLQAWLRAAHYLLVMLFDINFEIDISNSF